MDLGFAQALALAAHGDVWLRDAGAALPPLPCLEIPSLARGMGPRFVLTGVREPIAYAEGPWYRWLRDRGATRLRLIMVPRPLSRSAKRAAADGQARVAADDGAALLVTYPDHHERWIPTWRPRPAAWGRVPDCWAVTYRGHSLRTPPDVPDVSVAAAMASLGTTIAATLPELRERGDTWCPPRLEVARAHLCAPSPPYPHLDLLPSNGHGERAERLLAAAMITLEASEGIRPWPLTPSEFYEEVSTLLRAHAIAALLAATNGGAECLLDADDVGSCSTDTLFAARQSDAR